MAHAHIAKLRGDAKHCRRLARSFDDQPLVNAFQKTADEYDAEADRLEKEPPEPH